MRHNPAELSKLRRFDTSPAKPMTSELLFFFGNTFSWAATVASGASTSVTVLAMEVQDDEMFADEEDSDVIVVSLIGGNNWRRLG